MKIYDISVPIAPGETPVYPGDPGIEVASWMANARAVEEIHVRGAALGGCPRVLFKTRNSAFWEDPRGRFREDFTYIAPAAARALVTGGVRLVGIDYLSV